MAKALRTYFLLPLLGALFQASAQDGAVRGVVRSDADGGAMPYVNMGWAGASIGTTTDAEGRFILPGPPAWPAALVSSLVGYGSDTLRLAAPPSAPITITLRPSAQLKGIDVVERTQGTTLSTRSILSQEQLGVKELKRAACCDLSESFETNATVDVSFSDAISGTKTIRMLGLDGKYAQLSLENLPFIRGLSSTSGLTLIPGTWIHAINVGKGVGTAVNGPNAMTGQIDLCLVSPTDQPPLFVNLYGNSQGRTEANIHTAQKVGPHAANVLLLHGNLFLTEMDQNRDGFMDMPLTKRFNVMDRFLHQKDGRTSQLAVRYVVDEREGGQSLKHLEGDHAGHPLYKVDIRNEMVDVLAKHGFLFKNDATKSIGLMTTLRHHEAGSLFGERTYSGVQQSAYVSGVYQMLVGGHGDQLKAGLSFQYDDYAEAFSPSVLVDSNFTRHEAMPGAFAEYTFQRKNWTLVGGLRGDHNSWFGTALSPRLHLKVDLGPLSTIRISGGHGFRTANPLVENASVLASSRRVVVQGTQGMERAWTFGAGFLHKFKWLGRKWAIGADAYRTEFTAQLVTDLDRSPSTVVFYMLDGPSYANSVLADVQVELSRQFDLKISYRWYDVRTTYDGVLRERPFTPTHRGLVDLAYESRNEHWRADISWNLFGDARIPWTIANPEEYRFPRRSPAYSTVHAQLTYIAGAWEFYVGGENLTSAGQTRQIIAPDDPFGPYFDASLLWGPTLGAMAYGGLRYTLPNNRNNEP
ncbi:MAG: carboxypeptidase-like regulatory domain-containing protein [Flavobacteriales bacterium]|nr:carboxypeptidase-like regulatory domain-containing protein [Flavobacteriales bacterium]